MPGDLPAPSEKLILPCWARWVLGVVGGALILAGLALVVRPPEEKAFAPQCASKSCVAKVDRSTDAVASILVLGGLMVLVVGVNGRQLTGLKFAGAEATLASEVKDQEAKVTLAADVATELSQEARDEALEASHEAPVLDVGDGQASFISVAGAQMLRVEPSQVPARVVADLATKGVKVKASADIAWGARLLGSGNHPWYVRLQRGDTYKVSYGGQGKSEATVVRIESP